MTYQSPCLHRICTSGTASSAAQRYDLLVSYWIAAGMDLASARDMANASVRFDWSPTDQRDCQADADRARDNKDWIYGND